MKKQVPKLFAVILLCLAMCLGSCQINGGGGDTSAVFSDDTTEAMSDNETKTYTIKYNLGNGINPSSNPTSYTEKDTVTLEEPICQGYVFAGWYESGKDGVSMEVTIPAGSTGDREFSATWTENKNKNPELSNPNVDADNGINASPDKDKITSTSQKGGRGENLYTVKTVYTEIATDGQWDEAYGYGVHLKMDLPSNKNFYANRTTGYDVYIVLGQDRKAHCFVKVVDPDIVVNTELWSKAWWHCDSFQMYYDFSNRGTGSSIWTFVGEGNMNFRKNPPSEWKVVMTEKGFDVEFAFDNNGSPFANGDELGFGFYYNDSLNYIDINNYEKYTLKTSSAHNPASSVYEGPDASKHDAFVFSTESATGNAIGSITTPEKTGDMIADILSGAAEVAIIYADNASAHTVLKAEEVSKFLTKYSGNGIKSSNESLYAGSAQYEILVGLTSQPESAEALSILNYDQFSLNISEKRITLTAFNEEGMNRAVSALYACFEAVRDGKLSSNLASGYNGRIKNIPGINVPKLDALTTVTDAGDGAYLLLSEKSSESAYETYASKLVAAGYSLYAQNEMSTVLCRTYYNDDTVINLTFGKRDASLRVVVEPLKKTALPMLAPESYTPISVSSVTQVAPCNMCYIIKLDNGELIVIDSGNNGTEKDIYEQMQILCGDEDPVVAAWIFTHFHQDHIGGFIEFVAKGYCSKVKVKSIIYSFPSDQVLSTSSSSKVDQSNLSRWSATIRNSDATVYKTRTGQKYYFGNAEIEILFTYEDLMPFFVYTNDSNHTSAIFSVKIAGQKLMFVGDATNKSTQLVTVRYGSYLKSDFVQLAHHGKGDGGTFAGFYPSVGADYVLYPDASYAPSAAEKAACEDAKKYFLRDKSITIPLPYNE